MEELIIEFRYLEKICNDLYGAQHGVTLYINEMQQAGYASRSIPGWSGDLANLKRVRHIRNILVHEPDHEIEYDESDVEFIKQFYQRILDRQDPLALLRELTEQSSQKRTPQREEHPADRPSEDTEESTRADGCLLRILLAGIAVAILIALLRGGA